MLCLWDTRITRNCLRPKKKIINKKRSSKCEKKYKERQKESKVEAALEDQFGSRRVIASISSRPGQCGRADGYILEGKELEFYLRKIKARRKIKWNNGRSFAVKLISLNEYFCQQY